MSELRNVVSVYNCDMQALQERLTCQIFENKHYVEKISLHFQQLKKFAKNSTNMSPKNSTFHL
jgi:hypothetical protein